MLEQGTGTAGRQFCATMPSPCTVAGLANLEARTYAAEVVLLPVPRWALSVTECCRPSTTNLAYPGNLYLEATLTTLVPVPGTLPAGRRASWRRSSMAFSRACTTRR